MDHACVPARLNRERRKPRPANLVLRPRAVDAVRKTHREYFHNSIREDGLIALAAHGIIFASGKAGTLQEIFQDSVRNYYRSAKIPSARWFSSARHTGRKSFRPRRCCRRCSRMPGALDVLSRASSGFPSCLREVTYEFVIVRHVANRQHSTKTSASIEKT